MKFKYWVAESLNDHQCYSYTAKTKKELLNKLKGDKWAVDSVIDNYIENDSVVIEQREVNYEDMYDFFTQVTGEGGGMANSGYTVSQYHYDAELMKQGVIKSLNKKR